MSVSPPGHWLLNRMVFLLNRTLEIINTTVEKGIVFLLQNSNTFTGINTFKGGINVDNIYSINGNTTFNSEIIVNSNITANNESFIGDNLVINNIYKNTTTNISVQNNIDMNNNYINRVDTILGNTLYINVINNECNTGNISVQNTIDMNSKNINRVDTIIGNTLSIDVINKRTTGNISVLNTIDMNNNYIINANIAGLNNIENGLINSQRLTLSKEDDNYEINFFNFGAKHGINTIDGTKLNIWKGNSDISYVLFLPENNGQTTDQAGNIIGGNQQTHTQSILGIGAFYKQQNSLQSLNNSQCYLIPPSMISSDVPALKGPTLFKTIGDQTGNIQYLAGYLNQISPINDLKNTLVPTVGQIVDLVDLSRSRYTYE